MTDLPTTCPDHPHAMIRHSWRTHQLEYQDGTDGRPSALGGPGC
jgi:hypothetical protein